MIFMELQVPITRRIAIQEHEPSDEHEMAMLVVCCISNAFRRDVCFFFVIYGMQNKEN